MSQTNIDYQFVKIPLNLFNCLDNNCRSVLFSLIQLSSYYATEEKDGWFYRSNDDLGAQCNISKNVMDAALDALYINHVIDVIPCEKGQGKRQVGKRFKVLFESFKEFEKISIEDSIKNPEYRICTVDYKKNRVRSYQLKLNSSSSSTSELTSIPTSSPTSSPTSELTSSQSDNNIYNIENKENTYNINNIEEIYNYLIINKKSIFEEGLDKLDYQLYSNSTMDFLDRYEKELYNSFKYFNNQEFEGKEKFYELVSSDSISLEGVEELFKFCIRKQRDIEEREQKELTISPTFEEEPIDESNISYSSAPATSCSDGKGNKTTTACTSNVELTEEQVLQLKSIDKRIELLVRASLGQIKVENRFEEFMGILRDYMSVSGYGRQRAEKDINSHYEEIRKELMRSVS